MSTTLSAPKQTDLAQLACEINREHDQATTTARTALATVTGLSAQQREILLWIVQQTHLADAGLRSFFWSWRSKDGTRYVGWRQHGFTRSESASSSRALRRLEQRGLLERANWCSDAKRTTAVRLTPLGRSTAETLAETEFGPDWAERLTKQETEDVNRCFDGEDAT